jgi:hypothetical protein
MSQTITVARRANSTSQGRQGAGRQHRLSALPEDGQRPALRDRPQFDGIFVLRTNTNPLEAMLCYKQFWTVEQTFRTAKHLLSTRPIFHKLDETIRGSPLSGTTITKTKCCFAMLQAWAQTSSTSFSSDRGSALGIGPFDDIAGERARLGEDVRCSIRDRRIASILSKAASGDSALPIAGSAAASIRSVRCSKTRPFETLAFCRFL